MQKHLLYVFGLLLSGIYFPTLLSGQCQTPNSSDQSRCGKGTLTFTASGNSGPYSWYDAASGGRFFSNGSSFTSPFLTTTDTFFVEGNTLGTTNDALSFDGSDDYVAIQGKNYSSNGEITALTVEAWVRTSVTGANWYSNWSIVDFDRSEYYNVYISGSTGVVGFSTTDNAGNIQDFYAKTPVNDGNWHHIAAVYDGTDKKVYVDGVLDSTVTNAHSGRPLGTGNYTRYGFLGDGSEASSFNGTRNNYYYQGDIDELRIWSTALTSTEINNNMNSCLTLPQNYLELYYRMNDGSGTSLTDYSGNGYNGTLYNMSNPWISTGPGLSSCPNCSSTRTRVIANILPQPQPNLGNDTCVTQALTLDAGSGYTNYLWNTGATTQSISVNSSGFYSVTVDSSGTSCQGSDGISVSMLLKPDGIDTFRCGPGSLDLSLNNPNSNMDYYWYDQATGGNVIGTGTTFTTASISSTTDYYVAEVDLKPTSDAMSFDGSNDYVAIQNKVYNGTGYSELTVEAWVRTTDGSDQIIASFDRSEYWRLEINGTGAGSGKIGFDINTDAGILDFGGNTAIDDGNWHHVAVTFKNGTVNIYIDGSLDASTNMGSTFGSSKVRYGFLGVGSEAPSFDGSKGPSSYFNGDLDEVRIWSVARNISQIQSYKGQCLTGSESGLEIYYKMEDGAGSSTLSDHSNNGNNGTLRNMNTSTAWINSGQSIDCSCGESPRDTVTASIQSVPAVDLGNDTCANAAFTLDAGAGFTSYLWQDGSTTQSINANTSRLYWVEVSQAGTQCKGYDTIAVSIGSSVQPIATDSSRCGAGNITLKATSPDNIYWYDQSSGGNLLGIGDSISVGPLSSDSVFYMASNSESVTGLHFNGSSNYVAIQNKNFNTKGAISTLTAEAWINTSYSGGANYYVNWSIIDFDRSEYFNMWVSATTGRVNFSTTDSSGTIDDFEGNTAVNDGNWHHIAVVYDGTDKLIYVDGALDATKTNPHNGWPLGTGVTRYGFIGDGSEASSFNGARNEFYYEGDIDEVRLWNTARTANEINNNKSTCLAGNESGLVIYYRMSEGTGSSLSDFAGNNNASIYGATWITTAPGFTCSNCAASGRKAVTATILPAIGSTSYTISCPGDGGTELYLQTSGGSSSFDYREINGVFGYSGSYQSGIVTKVVPNGGNYDIEVKDENGCTSSVSGIITPPKPGQLAISSGSNNGCIVPQKNDWFYINDASSDAIIALKSTGTNLGLVSANVYVDAGAGIYNGFAYMKRHYVIQSQNAPNSTVNIRLYFKSTELTDLSSKAAGTTDPNDDISSINQLNATMYEGPTEDGVFDTTDATLVEYILQNSNGNQFGGNYIEISTNSFSEYWLHASSQESALPIELISFSAEKENHSVLLKWQTASEINNDYFTIQRSDDGKNFENLSIIKGAGNSSTLIKYEYTDTKPLSGISYYRLKQTDFDGRTTNSKTISISLDADAHSPIVKIFPNPATDEFNIVMKGFQSSESIYLTIYNMTGNPLMEKHFITNQNGELLVRVEDKNLRPGIYILNIYSGGKALNKRIVIQ